MSQAAYSSSVLDDADLFRTLGISQEEVFDGDRADPSPPKRNAGTALGWIREGAVSEDDTPRPLNHFFDPLRGTGLLTVLGVPSPEWALEDLREQNTQENSYSDAREHFFRAVTATSESERGEQFALMFQTLGQVIHHVQDMAQPQHVRNDPHLDRPERFLGAIPNPLFNPSRFEVYTDQNRDTDWFLDYLAPNAYPAVRLHEPRKFWQGGGTGLADFTNRNFLSAGKNFTAVVQDGSIALRPHPDYPQPVWDQESFEEVPIRALLQEPDCLGTARVNIPDDLFGVVTFLGTSVADVYVGTTARNRRATTLSIFDQDLETYGKTVTYSRAEGGSYETSQVFSLNRFNFCAAYPFLIPKAVGYSAGLIDYFFRGRLEAEDVEFTAAGFRLRVKNAIDPQKTPTWKDEVLYAKTGSGNPGTLVLAYEYKDGNGAIRYGASPAVALSTDLAPGEISSAHYDFAVSIPSEGREVKYRLVFRGKLGHEEDGIAIGGVEPVSGFLVTPNYLPDDGIPGRRMIYKSSGQWRLSESKGLVAGEVDWKGWYVGDRPSRVLSWHGPEARYFPREADHFSALFSHEIYRDGEVFAVAPHRVLGAALNKGADGADWLVAICHDGIDDIVYRRPAKRSSSAALFHPVTAPDGWLEIGRHAGSDYLAPDRPWFFNGSGTAAQTLRPARKTEAETDVQGTKLARLAVSVGADMATFRETDNLGPLVTRYSNVPVTTSTTARIGDYDVTTYEGSRTFSWNGEGEYIVAVDYKKDEPIECRLVITESGVSSRVGTVTKSECRNNCGVQDRERRDMESLVSFSNSEHKLLRCGTFEATLKFVLEERQTVGRSEFRFGWGPVDGKIKVYRESEQDRTFSYKRQTSLGAIAGADLRHDLVAMRTRSESIEHSDSYASDRAAGGECINHVNTQTPLIYRRLTQDVRFGREVITAFSDIDPEASLKSETLQMSFYDASASCGGTEDHWELKRFPGLTAALVDGGWRVDGAGNLVVSQSVPGGFFNYISDGSLEDIIRSGGEDASYYPVRVIR